jgi:flavin-binding protein dodecin
MADNTYKVIELVGSSDSGLEDAVHGALARASQTIKGLDWFEVKEIRGTIGDAGKVNWYQVKMEVGFRVMEAADLQRG